MKKRRFPISARMALSFGMILVVICIICIVFLMQLNRLTRSIEDIYIHPFTISNTMRGINGAILEMQGAMKDIVLSETEAEIRSYAAQVDTLEKSVLDDFTIVYGRYLGDMTDVDNAHDAFIEWRVIRDEVIEQALAGNKAEAAAIMRGKGARYVRLMDQRVRGLISFAENKAISFFSQARDVEQTAIKILWALFGLAVLVSAAISILTIRSISLPVLQIVGWIREIAEGKLNSSIDLDRNDEIGELSESCRIMQNNLTHKSDIAKQIAVGDFSGRVEVQSRDDEVALSINRIADNYSRIYEENTLQNWLTTGTNMLNEQMQGELNPAGFGRNVISCLAVHLDAQIGALYIADLKKSELRLTGSYALTPGAEINDVISFGYGLAGQCALEQDIISVRRVPEDYFRIGSGTGGCKPVHVITVPIMFEARLAGVVELGSVHAFGARELQFLKVSAVSIGIGLNSVIIRERTEELLRETQIQAEELIQQQEELRVSNEELEEKTEQLQCQKEATSLKNLELGKAMKELAATADELRSASTYKSEFMANMSHELRTPLNSIIILSNLLSRNSEGNLTEKEEEFARTIHSSGSDLLHLINEILDLSKIEAGKLDILYERFTLEQLMSSLQRNFQQIALEKGIDFTIEIDQALPGEMHSDKRRVEQVLKNLLSNAFKFTRRGSVALHAGPPDPKTRFTNESLKPSGTIAFAVSDTGKGIAREKQTAIFEAFQQADGTTSREYGGTGLGLSISLELAKSLGGELQMTSEEGKGSTFTLYLPVSPEKSKEIPVLPETMETIADDRKNIEPGDKSVLIIADDPVFVEIVLDFTRQRDFKGIIAPDGETGLHFADYYSPSAIILDIGLPGINGWEVMKRLKKNDTTRHIPVHIATGSDNSVEAYRLGAVGFVEKPVDPAALDKSFSNIERILEGTLKKLLLIGDDDDQRKSILELLRGKDLEISEAATGAQALELAKHKRFDCMVLDLGMNDMSGFDFLSRLRQGSHDMTPVIVYTAKGMTMEEEAELQKYAESVIIKGVCSPDRLLEETALFLHRVESELPKNKQRDIQMFRDRDSTLNGKTILLVDDDMRNVFAISSVLERRGMNIVVGRNGRDGLEKLTSAGNIDLVLMDIMMPEMDGYEAMGEIRKTGKYKNLPIIALTAKAMKGDRNKCIEAGASDYLAKPVDTDKLISLLRVWLHG